MLTSNTFSRLRDYLLSSVFRAALTGPTLGTLTLSDRLMSGTASRGTINGATTGSTITSNIAGLTVNSSARTYAFDGTASAATVPNGLVETLSGASPKSNAAVIFAAGTLPASVFIVAEGDSITTGLQGTGGDTSYVDLVMDASPFQLPGYAAGNTGSTTYTYRKVSQSGETAQSMDSGYTGAGGSAILAPGAGPAGGAGGTGIGAGPSFDSTKAMNILTMHAGTNDGVSAAEYAIYRALRSYFRKARATGYQRIIGSTILSRTVATYTASDTAADHNFDGNTAAINVSIRQYALGDLGCDYLCDFAADPWYDTQADYAPHTPDGTHPNNAGYANMASIYQAGLTAMVQSSAPTPKVQGLTWSKYDQGGNCVLSADLKSFSATATKSQVRGLPQMPVGSGKWYWEILNNTAVSDNYGLCTAAYEPYIYAKNGSPYNASASGGAAIAVYGNVIAFGNAIICGTYYPAKGDITQTCFDADTGLVWVRTQKASDGTYTTWNGSATADPSTGVGGVDIRTGKLGSAPVYPVAYAGGAITSPEAITCRFASADQTLHDSWISSLPSAQQAAASAFKQFDKGTF